MTTRAARRRRACARLVGVAPARRLAPRIPTTSADVSPAIPTRGNEAAVACPDYIYNNRNLVERLWGRLKEWRAVATRYEKTATSYLGVLCLAATMDWLKP